MNFFKKALPFIFAALVVFVTSSLMAMETENSTIKVSINHPWSPAAPPVAPARVGYFILENHSDKKIKIIKAASPMFMSVSFHETKNENGVSSMHQRKELVVNAKENLAFKTGGLHLMLMEKTALLTAEVESIPIELSLEKGEKITFELSVKNRQKNYDAKVMNHGVHSHH